MRSMCRVLIKKTRLRCTMKTVNLHVRLTLVCLTVCPLVCDQNAKKKRFSQKLSNLELWSLLTNYVQEVVYGLFKQFIIGPLKSKMAEMCHLEKSI